jgi:anti-sigma factor RsiW
MKCEYTDRLVEYLDGEMAEGEARALHAHVESCAVCRGRIALLRRSYAALEALATPEVPEGFAARVKARTARRTPVMPRVIWSALSAAAMVLLALGVYWAGGERGTGPGTGQPGTTGTATVAGIEGLTVEEQAVIENLDFLEDYEVLRDFDMLADYDTLTELEDLETIILPDGELS